MKAHFVLLLLALLALHGAAHMQLNRDPADPQPANATLVNSTQPMDEEHEELAAHALVDQLDSDSSDNSNATASDSQNESNADEEDAVNPQLVAQEALAKLTQERSAIALVVQQLEKDAEARHESDSKLLKTEVDEAMSTAARQFQETQANGGDLEDASATVQAANDEIAMAQVEAQQEIDMHLNATKQQIDTLSHQALDAALAKYSQTLTDAGINSTSLGNQTDANGTAFAPSQAPTEVNTDQALRSAVAMLLGVKEQQEKQNKQPIFLSLESRAAVKNELKRSIDIDDKLENADAGDQTASEQQDDEEESDEESNDEESNDEEESEEEDESAPKVASQLETSSIVNVDDDSKEVSQSTLALIVGAVVVGILLLALMIWWLSTDGACCARKQADEAKLITDEDRAQAAAVHAKLLQGDAKSVSV